MSAFDVLMDAGPLPLAPLCVLVGSDGFLKHEARRTLAARLAGPAAAESVDILDGTAELRDVLDALGARSLFGGGGPRIVVVEDADALVKNFRAELEDYAGRPYADAALVLEVTSWPGNTRLAKAVAASGLTIACQTPDRGAELTAFNRQLKKWLVAVAQREHQCELAPPAVDLLLDLLPSEPGILYQEVARLALLGGGTISLELVRQYVGGWRTRQTWDMIDAAADGLLAAGEEPHAILPQMASTLRRFALAVRLFERAERRNQPITLRAGLQEAGVLPFKLADAERQLRQIGRPRARQLSRWLLAADLSLKGHNSGKGAARRVIETLVLRLSREVQPDPSAATAQATASR
jgi:DNA polymerase-3 subunit delta